jgi:diguanylate cyclase (GGDEF)-like protein
VIRIVNSGTIKNTFGERAYESIIKEIAKAIKLILYKDRDWDSRYVGTDFLLVIHGTNENKANRVCKRIYEKINNLKFDLSQKNTNVAIRVGYYIVTNQIVTPEQAIDNAVKMISATRLEGGQNSGAKQYEKFFNKFRLTTREREIALLLTKGYSNNQIAEKLFVGLSTIKKHMSSIFVKTNLKSRAELIARIAIRENPM